MVSKEKAFDPVARTPASSAPSSNGGADVAAAEVERLARELRGDGARVVRDVKRIALVEWKRANLRAIDVGIRIGAHAFGIALALGFALAAGVLFVIGIRGALLAAIGIGWVADLAAALVILATVAGALVVYRMRMRSSLLASTKRAIAAMRDPMSGDTSAEAGTR